MFCAEIRALGLSSHHTRFATMILASAARRGSMVDLRLTSGGHPNPLIVRADGTVEEADTHGTLIGAIPTISATTAAVPLLLAPGESCVLYTDGITEARGGPMGDALFGDARLERALSQCVGMPAEGIAEHVQMLAAQWLGNRSHDDMAVAAVAAHPAPPTRLPQATSQMPPNQRHTRADHGARRRRSGRRPRRTPGTTRHHSQR